MFTQAMTVALDETAGNRTLVARSGGGANLLHERRLDRHPYRRPGAGGCYHLSASCIPRIQHMAVIERQFDADPQLAALVADLAEEVRSLREQLAFHLRGG